MIVLRTSRITGLAGLLRSPFCNIVSCCPQLFESFEQWQLHSERKPVNLLAQLREVAEIYEQAPAGNRQRLELHLHVRSDHPVTPAVSAELIRVKPAITEIREHAQMMKTAALLFPMDSLRVCGLTLPSTLMSLSTLQSAMKLARNLEFLQVYVATEDTARIAVKFIAVLPDLPRVASLRVISSGCATCLPVTCLQHVTHLELGQGVYCDGLPTSLRSLAMQTCSTHHQGYAQMLAKLSLAPVPINIIVECCESADLARLDTKLREFRLQSPMFDVDDMEHSCTCRLGLARLSKLQVLCVSDFLTATLVELLEPLCFPELHTFGFGVEEMDCSFLCADTNTDTQSCMATPAQDVIKLGVTFPALQQLDIHCEGTGYDILIIKAEGISSAFPRLCGVTWHGVTWHTPWPVTRLELHGLPGHVQVAAKF